MSSQFFRTRNVFVTGLLIAVFATLGMLNWQFVSRENADGPATPTTSPASQPSASSDAIKSNAARQKAAEDLVARAMDAEAKKDLSGAMSLYQQAVHADSSNEIALAGRDRMRAALGLTPVGKGASGLQSVATQTDLEHDAIQTRFNLAVDNATKALPSRDYQTAQAQIANATAIVSEDPDVFTAEEIAEMKVAIAALNAQLQGDGQADTLPFPRYSDPVFRPDKQSQSVEVDLRFEIARLTEIARMDQEERDYSKMLDALDQILALDPNNAYASQMRPAVQDLVETQQQKNGRPQTRPATNPLNSDGSDSSDIQVLLSRELPIVQFNQISFIDAIDFLKRVTTLNIVVDWAALKTAGVNKDSVVSLSLTDVRVREVLQMTMDQAAGGAGKLGYTIIEGTILISSVEQLENESATKPSETPDPATRPASQPSHASAYGLGR